MLHVVSLGRGGASTPVLLGCFCLRCSYFWRSARLAASSVGDVCFRFAGSFSACCFPFGCWGGFRLASRSVLDLMVPGRSKTISPVRPSTRPRGGTTPSSPGGSWHKGLSPRLRGNRFGPKAHKAGAGSIPAFAGEPAGEVSDTGRPSVYPRVCGGTEEIAAYPLQDVGLSPRLRGNQPSLCYPPVAERSIPAFAGEPG